MRLNRDLLGLTVISMVLVAALGPPAFAAPGDLTLASTSSGGAKGDLNSATPSMSFDGTLVAFASRATNLHPADADFVSDVFVKDLTTGNLTLVSTSDAGVKGNGDSYFPSISADGRFVVFDSIATNLDADDTDNIADVYVKDLVSGELTLVSTSDAGVKGNGDSMGPPSITPEGPKVAFTSSATNLDPDDTDTLLDVYVKDLATFDLTLASTSDTGVKGDLDSALWPRALSAEGVSVVFQSNASNLDPADMDTLPDVYVKDLATGVLTLASTSVFGEKGNAPSSQASISVDGRFVAFGSGATNIHPDDADTATDVYVKDLATGGISLASTSDSGAKGDSASAHPSISGGGTLVAFTSMATNLDPGDIDSVEDVYVKDWVTGDLELASTSSAGVKGDSVSWVPALSGDVSRVAFTSFATNLDPADTDSTPDVYVKELGSPPTTSADLSIAKTDRPDPVRAGRRLTYTIKVKNRGPDQATGVTITDQLPAGVRFVSVSSPRGSCGQAAGIVTCTYAAPVGVGARGAVTVKIVVVTPSTPGPISNTARVSANETDPVPGNNQDTETTNVI